MNVLVNIYRKENPDGVKCTWCDWQGTENEILFDASAESEHFLKCKRPGCLMDVKSESLDKGDL